MPPPRQDEATLEILRTIARESRRVAGLGTGAFLLGQMGLLNGLRATKHWSYARQMREDFPNVRVEQGGKRGAGASQSDIVIDVTLLARWSGVACSDGTQDQASHLRPATRTTATGGSIRLDLPGRAGQRRLGPFDLQRLAAGPRSCRSP